MAISWSNTVTLNSKNFTCGHCGNPLASNVGYSSNKTTARIYICHFCSQPTYFSNDDKQVPGSAFGYAVEHIPAADVLALYEEARNCLTVNAFTASILCSRKLLMNIAVSKGAPEGLKFVQYVSYLADNNYLPPNGAEWADHIRKIGNIATHEIKIMSRAEAEELLIFLGMLLKFIYEFPGKMKTKSAPPTNAT